MAIDLHRTTGRPIDLLGAGIDNMALLPHLDGALELRMWVDDLDSVPAETRATCERFGATIGAVADWVGRTVESNRLVVRSPGFPRYRSDIAAALSRSPAKSVTTAINLWLATFGDRYPTVFVTGTKGKSTVSRMLAALVPGSELVGNIGTPIWSIPLPAEGSIIVCEISSYQAVDMTHHADLALLTSLSEDHISWHGSVERYHADKLNPVRTAHRALTVEPLVELVTGPAEVRSIAADDPNDSLNSMPAHMATNARLALAAARWLHEAFGVTTVPDPNQTLLDLPPLVGRLREIPSGDEHRWFDDSLASNPSGAAAAVAAFAADDLYLIIGGLDRSVSLDPFISAVRSCAGSVSVVTVPDNGEALAAQLEAGGLALASRLAATDVATAVAMIRRDATRPSTVLFSPAAPTPPQHGNWANRSAAFEAAVLERPP